MFHYDLSLLPYEAPEDYTTVVQTLTFNSSTSSIDLLIPLVDDNTVEEDQIFFANLTNPSAPDVTLDPAQATITIEDNEDRKCQSRRIRLQSKHSHSHSHSPPPHYLEDGLCECAPPPYGAGSIVIIMLIIMYSFCT